MGATGRRLSVIICSLNRMTALQGTLAAIHELVVPPGWDVELLLVDNGSTDGTAELMQSFRPEAICARALSMPLRGRSNALNMALAEAQGDIIVLTDDDVRPRHDWLERLCTPIFEGECDAAVGRTTLAPELERPELTWFHRSLLACTDHLQEQQNPDLVGANMAFRREALERVPALDLELGPGALGFMDDTLFSRQLKAAGFRTRFVGNAGVEHHPDPARINRASMLRQAQMLGASEAYVDHHWSHLSVRAPRLQCVVRSLRLGAWRATNRAEARAPSIASWNELVRVIRIAYFRQFAIECSRPRNYALQGLKHV